MRTVQTCQGPFLVWDVDQVGAVIGDGIAFWDWPIKPYLDKAAAAYPWAWALDVGAAFGWFTVYLAQRFSHVVAVEANAETIQHALRPNLAAHNVSGKVDIHCAAAYSRRVPMALVSAEQIGWPLHPLPEQPNASSLAYAPVDAAGFHTVPGVALDDLIPDDAPIACIKVDVQGCDLRALYGLERTIKRCRPIICWEYEMGPSLWHGDTFQDYQAFFTRHGYQLTALPGQNYAAEPLW